MEALNQPRDLLERRWDAIVIGAGMAGATLGHALARAGLKVLFCELGRSLYRTQDGHRGEYAEATFGRPEVPGPDHRDLLLAAGRYPNEIADLSRPKARRLIPFLGAGSGGSSALYGGALERFYPSDFEPRAQHPEAGESTLPETWPISYDELAPYYRAAEQLYRVRGTVDPLRAGDDVPALLEPPSMTAASRELFDEFSDQGLHPYRLPQACEFVEGCEGCQGFLCPRECKNDSGRICLRPALEEHGAGLLDECEVFGFDVNASRVTGVLCRHQGREMTLTTEIVVLAAGALDSPRLLMRSASSDWPDGLANRSGLVGRNLMRHFIDLYAIRTAEQDDLPGNHKEVALNDFYASREIKLGTVQSFGSLPPSSILFAELRRDVSEGSLGWLAPLMALGAPVVLPVLKSLSRGVMLATVMEDLPYEDNRVLPTAGAERLALSYRISEHEQRRIERFRRRLAEVLRPFRFRLIKQAESNSRLAHACGTCRFGDDPENSVLDRWNRAHGVDNLYVVDASFFPSSGGTNPALTIAANALRVADHIIDGSPVRGSTDE
jgi:choline dehydrogenase-like flavoprotein